jgi:hypothetical protein
MILRRPACSVQKVAQKNHVGILPSLFEFFLSKEIVGCPMWLCRTATYLK